MNRVALGILISFALAMPAAAKDPAPSTQRKTPDPNQVVCEKQEVLGSRLAVRKVCMTRSEWAAQRQSDRSLVERSQLGSCQQKSGC
ncbi:hypothetical protein G4G27_17855 [Sphingomonas sp. So64.6b]|uniref:hypothetical protein n=1 Tax=Sphingomonas sp. So64.6b TaxID=2997354 RepID=UPI0015FEEF7B|nr:hypothetical protein [Sphingomonas sp. So64.6b]QNA85641.1 hypothetical protein G4G27_17855 [Sphingomonas sp. So64.6b]